MSKFKLRICEKNAGLGRTLSSHTIKRDRRITDSSEVFLSENLRTARLGNRLIVPSGRFC